MTPWTTRRIRISTGALVAVLLAVAVVAAPAGAVRACSCDDLPLAAYADTAIAAFMGRQTGRVVEDEFAEYGAELTFDVEEVFLGDVSTELRVRTEADFDACGVDLDGAGVVGILVFEFRGESTVGACPAAVSRAELESVFGPSVSSIGSDDGAADAASAPGPSTSSIGPDDDAGVADSSRSNNVARAALIGVLLVILVAGAVVARRRRQQAPSDGN